MYWAATLALVTMFSAEPARAEKAQLELLRRGAQKAIEEKRYEKAIAQLEMIQQLDPDPKNLLDIALAYDAWGELCVETMAAFDAFFAACKDCALLDNAKNEHVLAQNRCAAEISFAGTPEGAVVVIDGDRWARVTPFVIQLRPGAHELEIRLPGYATRKERLDVAPKAAARFDSTLAPLEAPAGAPPKAVDAANGPSALELIALGAGVAGGAAGAYFTFSAIDDVDAERAARFSPAQDLARVDELRSSAETKAILATIGFVVSLAGFVGSAVLEF